MSNDYPRSHRVADYIQRELALLVRNELKDPRVSPMLTISSVEVTRDLSSARVYYTLLDDSEQQDTQTALVNAAGFLRKSLARVMRTRTVPTLRFYYDDSVARGAHMSSVIADAMASNTTPADDDDLSDLPDAGKI